MSKHDLQYTVADIIAELSKLPADSIVAVPIRWTLDVANSVYEDELASPLTTEQWAKVSSDYLDGLGEFFYEDSNLAMTEALEPYLKTEE